MSWVANGSLQGYVSWGLNSYDVAAGHLIVKEAGGKITDHKGEGRMGDLEEGDLVVTGRGGGELRDIVEGINEREPGLI